MGIDFREFDLHGSDVPLPIISDFALLRLEMPPFLFHLLDLTGIVSALIALPMDPQIHSERNTTDDADDLRERRKFTEGHGRRGSN